MSNEHFSKYLIIHQKKKETSFYINLHKYQSDYAWKITVHPQNKKAKQWNLHINGNTVTNCSVFSVFFSSLPYSLSPGAYYILTFKTSIALFCSTDLIYLAKHDPSLK